MTTLTIQEREEQYNREMWAAYEDFCTQQGRSATETWDDFFELFPQYEPIEDCMG